ncbi:MAG: hypothetical protein FWE67_15555 [Planctomycetaceae bacterium]|nr:hypothetical protein [Planctomycetaceae bacterium]
MRTTILVVSLVVLLPVLSGCDLAKPQAPVADMPVQTTPAVQPATPPAPQEESASAESPDTTVAEMPGAALTEQSAQPEQPEGTERVKADVGAGKKGHYGQKGGEAATDIITVPIATLFRAQEITAYRIKVPQAMQLYKASNDGKAPATHEEYWEKIIKANEITLPQLPDGQRYVYDPATEGLLIEKPKPQ